MSPTNLNAPPDATDPLSTPPRADVTHTSTLKSTPGSRGAAVISGYIRYLGVDVENLCPWIEHNIEQAQMCHADAMLSALLQRASNNLQTEQPHLLEKCLAAVVGLCNTRSGPIRESLKKYVKSGDEHALYEPFIQLANGAFAGLGQIKVDGMPDASELAIMCQQNDPKNMEQYHQDLKSIRRPDVVIIPFSYNAFPEVAEKTNSEDLRRDLATEQPEVALRWEDVLACIEFKRPTKKDLSKPKDEYTVAGRVLTKPEYLRVERPSEDPVPNVPATAETGVSKTPAVEPAPAVEPRRSTRISKEQSSKRKADEPSQPSARKRAKTGDKDRKLDVTVQTGLYAAEMFAANVAVTRIINLIVVGVLLVGCALINVITFLDDMIWIWYYDRQGTIQNSGINIIQDLPRFMVLLYALQRFSLDDWGRSTQFKRDEQNVSHNITIFDKHFGDVDPKLLTSDKDKVKNYGLKGRATNVFPVTSKTLEKKYAGITKDGMVAKIFWAEEQRTSEPKILEKVAEIAASHPNTVKGHVLDLLWYHKFEEPTSEIRQQLGVPEPKKGSRVLYILVFRKLFPITELTDAEFFKAWKKCIECHFVLWQEGVYHRDISPPNMMFYRNEKGTAIGVLNDYDLSSLKDAQGPQGNERTGTVPFMALDLLTSEGQGGQVKHLYHHDLESFMWVLAWVCLLYEGGKLLTSKHPLDAWATNDAETVYEKKLAFLKNFTKFKPSGIDSLISSLVAHCLQMLKDDDHRREKLQFELEHSLNLREEVTVELDDKVLLDIFTSTTPWVQLSLQIGVADI